MPAPKKTGFTVVFQEPPVIVSAASIVGRKEGQGPLRSTFDKIIDDPYFGEKHWEAAEQRFLEETAYKALEKANLKPDQIDYFLAGDLLNQLTSSSFSARALDIPYLGLFSACSTMYEGLIIAGTLLDGGFAERVLVSASSHYGAGLRRFGYASELAAPRPPSASYTVTGAGAMVLAREGTGPTITHATIGRVVDFGINDPNNCAAAMVPACVDTAIRFLKDTGLRPQDFDFLLTGDLGHHGSRVFGALIAERGYDIAGRHQDGGVLIYDRDRQDTDAGGCGCACSAVVTCGHVMQLLHSGRVDRVLALGSGALLNGKTTWQGETIPAISHAIVIEKR